MKPVRKDYYPRIEAFINAYRKSYGTAPSIKEIAAMLQVSDATAWRYVQRMAQEGIIEYQGGYGRIMTMQDQQPEQFVDVPAVGAVSCGLPAFAEENIEEYVRLPRKWVGSGNNVFILRADGHSMINAGIDTGDMVIIRQQQTAEPNQIIVALVDDEEATLKRYRPHPESNIVELVPENDEFDVQVVDLTERKLMIQGVVIGVYKFFDKEAAL